MLSDHCLSCLSCLSCPVLSALSVMLVYCGQTAAWIKMPLGAEVGLGPGYIVLDGEPALPPKKGHSTSPTFWPMLIVAKRIKMPLGTVVGLGPGYIVLHGDPAVPPKKGHSTSPHFLAYAYCGQTDQDATWHGGRPQPRPHCVRCRPNFPPTPQPPTFRPISIGTKRLDGSCHLVLR